MADTRGAVVKGPDLFANYDYRPYVRVSDDTPVQRRGSIVCSGDNNPPVNRYPTHTYRFCNKGLTTRKLRHPVDNCPTPACGYTRPGGAARQGDSRDDRWESSELPRRQVTCAIGIPSYGRDYDHAQLGHIRTTRLGAI